MVPILLANAIWHLWTGLRNNEHWRPFLKTGAIFVLSNTGLDVSFYPNLVPPSLSVPEGATSNSSLPFQLVDAVIRISMILAYTAYSYWVFRGKVHSGDRYH